jgi:FkbM family methyltransferase
LTGQPSRRSLAASRVKSLAASAFARLTFLSFPNRWSVLVSEQLEGLTREVAVAGGRLRLLSNSDLLLQRSLSFHTKEPETNAWIGGMPADGVFYDVGANVGVFTLLAATRARKVYAFEPVALNYAVLTRNLMLNSLDSKAVAYCLAIGEKTSFDTMRLGSGVIGAAHHTFGRNVDACHQEFVPAFLQGALSMSLDDLVYSHGFECPTYLKIDVDGNEHLVIKGAARLLGDARLKSVLIELNKELAIDKGVVETIAAAGFRLAEAGGEEEMRGMRIGNLIFARAA